MKKSKDSANLGAGIGLIGAVAIAIYLLLSSCATSKVPYEQAKKKWYCTPEKKYKPNGKKL